MNKPFFAVIGGMGTLATESYIRLVDRLTGARDDQEFLDYVVFNDASVPDRTAFMLGDSADDPFPVIADDIAKATAIGASFITIPCNTAHFMLPRFQELTEVPILNMLTGAVERMKATLPVATHPRVGFMGTEGSRHSGLYQREIEAAGYTFVEPDDTLQKRIDSLIYDDVKSGGPLSQERYRTVIDTFLDPVASGGYGCDIVVLGCTELSVLNEAFPLPQLPIIDAQTILAEDTVARAKALRH
ncbi:amino acid racemase [Bifidobacterium sp. ESL0763]|uniref:aspartate/glutamate racemase family protein n=1 Tax=Bifidobacterium sp. ESL0763 TaxID=2983227 RepID=UPI0023F9A591|nr:amino acid racemase [Bifidobacterium sp. ESL0763]MDF7664137.1 amino acid racemase [Bifidobacterium sp. ESL0763]